MELEYTEANQIGLEGTRLGKHILREEMGMLYTIESMKEGVIGGKYIR